MESESSPVFKVSRVLWFPMSVNAVALGALCFVLFWLWTFFSLAVVGSPSFELTGGCVSAFDDTVKSWLIDGTFAEHTPVALLGAPETVTTRYRWIFGLQIVGAYLIWAIGVVAISRVMAVRIARDEYITLKDALTFAWSTRFTALLYAPAILLSMLFLWLAVFGIGLVGQIPFIGWILSAVLLPVTVFFVILVRILAWAGVLSLGMTAGAIACEKKGTWDSVAKAFNYVFARPLSVLLYVVLLWVFIRIVQGVLLDGTHLREHVAHLLAPLWKPPMDYDVIARGAVSELTGMKKVAAFLHAVVFWVIDALIAGAILSWVVGAFTAMFLIFRKEVDGTDYSDIVKTTAPAP